MEYITNPTLLGGCTVWDCAWLIGVGVGVGVGGGVDDLVLKAKKDALHNIT